MQCEWLALVIPTHIFFLCSMTLLLAFWKVFTPSPPQLGHTRRSHSQTSPTSRLVLQTVVISVLCLRLYQRLGGKSVSYESPYGR